MWASTNDKDKKKGVLPQITINKVQDVLAQITRNNFILWNGKDKNLVCAGTKYIFYPN